MNPFVGIFSSGRSCNLTIFPSPSAEYTINVVSMVTELILSGNGALKVKVWLNSMAISSAEMEERAWVDVVVRVMDVMRWEFVLADERRRGRFRSWPAGMSA
jgi:hypothetical protein